MKHFARGLLAGCFARVGSKIQPRTRTRTHYYFSIHAQLGGARRWMAADAAVFGGGQ